MPRSLLRSFRSRHRRAFMSSSFSKAYMAFGSVVFLFPLFNMYIISILSLVGGCSIPEQMGGAEGHSEFIWGLVYTCYFCFLHVCLVSGRQSSKRPSGRFGVLSAPGKDWKDTKFFLCGSFPLSLSLWLGFSKKDSFVHVSLVEEKKGRQEGKRGGRRRRRVLSIKGI